MTEVSSVKVPLWYAYTAATVLFSFVVKMTSEDLGVMLV